MTGNGQKAEGGKPQGGTSRSQTTRASTAHGDRKLVFVQTADGIGLWPPDFVALARDEVLGRLEVTAADGTVAHRPGPLSVFDGPPWVEVAPGMRGHPAHARREGGMLVFPGGMRVESRVRLSPPPPLSPLSPLPGCGFAAEEVLFLRMEDGRACWHTDRGKFEDGVSLGRAARRHPTLVRAGHAHVNPWRLREVVAEGTGWRLIFDDGQELELSRGGRDGFARALGLPRLDRLEPFDDRWAALYALGLRDVPWEMLWADAAALQGLFGADERRLVANVIWQAYRWRAQGIVLPYGLNHRAFWYVPLFTILVRAGLMRSAGWAEGGGAIPGTPGMARRDVAESLGDAEAARYEGLTMTESVGGLEAEEGVWAARAEHVIPQYRRFEALLAEMVGTWRLFTFRELGFVDPRPDLRRVGQTRPDVVVLVEKGSLVEGMRALEEARGVTTVVTGGTSGLFATELLVDDLRAAGVNGPLVVMAYVDFDPAGWGNADTFVRQLARYGMEVRALRFLVRPSRFTPEERRLFSVPMPVARGQDRAEAEAAWVRQSGGVERKPLCMFANYLYPVQRVLAAFDEEMEGL